uniref:EamA domain-containing protein n=1 Tax=Aureoumbra lagunensis TaxID=44058 RepID=A0A7S3JU33_9STRA|mmetsp:Transcript_18120/g.27338  ORF Transcript_18120/g.27338 Transcript_18120/m.27338 type:complete len:457 (+) Transcript_18120:35-1405(+)
MGGSGTSSRRDEDSCGFGELGVFIGALVAGTGCSLFSKVMLSMKAVGKEGTVESFQNPLFQTWGMFLGMCVSLPMHMMNEAYKRRKTQKGDYTSISIKEENKRIPRSTYYLLMIPSLFDLAATALAMFGLTYITVSVYQMLRGAAIVFVAILKHFALKDKLASFQWVGVGFNVLSICMVGLTASGQSAGNTSGKNPLIGVGLILCGAIVQALQYAFEERVMSGDIGAPPLLVIAMEGIWGLLVCMLILYPACYFAGIEDPSDTWIMLQNSKQIQIVFAFYFISIFLYNMLAVLVTFMLNSVWHAILDNFRPISVWATDLLIYYFFSNGHFGEPWTYPHSYIQLAALVVLLYGTAIYNGTIRLPYFSYPSEEELLLIAQEGDDSFTPLSGPKRRSFRESPLIIRSKPEVASNTLGRSPLIYHPPSSRGSTPNQHGSTSHQALQMAHRPRASSFGNAA